jgi:hypothetical protein
VQSRQRRTQLVRDVRGEALLAQQLALQGFQSDERTVVILWQSVTRTPGAQATSGTLPGQDLCA